MCVALSVVSNIVSRAGLSNIIGIIVYISANAGDPTKSDSKKNSYSYGWSFYFGALSFIMAEMVGVLAVHMFIDRHRELRSGVRAADYLHGSAITRIPSYRYRYRRRSRSNSQSRSSSRSTERSQSREASPVGLKGFGTLPSTEISMYALKGGHGTPTATYNSDRDFLQVHNCIQKDLKDSAHGNSANRRTTPVWGTPSLLKGAERTRALKFYPSNFKYHEFSRLGRAGRSSCSFPQSVMFAWFLFRHFILDKTSSGVNLGALFDTLALGFITMPNTPSSTFL